VTKAHIAGGKEPLTVGLVIPKRVDVLALGLILEGLFSTEAFLVTPHLRLILTIFATTSLSTYKTEVIVHLISLQC
jgi:hypothetical protein